MASARELLQRVRGVGVGGADRAAAAGGTAAAALERERSRDRLLEELGQAVIDLRTLALVSARRLDRTMRAVEDLQVRVRGLETRGGDGTGGDGNDPDNNPRVSPSELDDVHDQLTVLLQELEGLGRL